MESMGGPIVHMQRAYKGYTIHSTNAQCIYIMYLSGMRGQLQVNKMRVRVVRITFVGLRIS